jgi:ABC-type uncharacterized transport system ATPase subunit
MFGEDYLKMEIPKGTVLLLQGARTSGKYGTMQLNISPEHGKVIVNPKQTAYQNIPEYILTYYKNA